MLGQSMRASVCSKCSPIAPDLVQDMYLKELKAYKAPPIKPTDAEGQVQKFSMPKAPASPEEADIANDLKAYEDQVPEVEGQAVAGSASAPEEDWFEDPEDEADVPPGLYHFPLLDFSPLPPPYVAFSAPALLAAPPSTAARMFDDLDVDTDTLDVLDFGGKDEDVNCDLFAVLFFAFLIVAGVVAGVTVVDGETVKEWALAV
ncbi:hypothetical protein B0A55_07100 [Friedmanniomyces simplex]|uniref:Uncharacterized protein n=1 Tax=Friedmanniomyces simplex TaxID=329884 RepID=A0A4U0X998_9PEZI|nr:hypothetical protein B0A55_07100 [Friedmanniomyces simplex]